MSKTVILGCATLALGLFASAGKLGAETRKETALSYVELGDKSASQKDFRRAIAAYNIAIQFDDDCAPAYFKRGLAEQAIGDSSKAIQDYTRAIEIIPEWAEAYANRAYILAMLHDADGAFSD